ncbi:hypothetical protein QNE90_001011 [Vibrio alginolyticus]|nr:hypothetical protein [Vibrio alginolyticus]
MMSSMIKRDVFFTEYNKLDGDYARPDLCIIRGLRKSGLDIGSLCYSNRERVVNSANKDGVLKVEPKSLIKSRCVLINKFIESLTLKNYSKQTVITYCSDLKSVINWLDDNGCSNAFDDINTAYESYFKFFDLNKNPNANISTRWVSSTQEVFRFLIGLVFDKESSIKIVSSVPILKYVKPEEDSCSSIAVKKIVNVSLNLAYQLMDFVVNEKKYPFLMKMDGYSSYLFPTKRDFIVTPFSNSRNKVFDYENGCFKSAEEIQRDYAKDGEEVTISFAEGMIKSSQLNMDKVNSNSRHEMRLICASLSQMAFMKVFSLMTGSYESEIRKLTVSDVESAYRDIINNNYKVIKARAGNIPILYTLGKDGMKIMQDYLRLRTWILDGQECEYLFFRMEHSGKYTGEFSQLKTQFLHKYLKKIKGRYVENDVKSISPRDVRKYKSDILSQLRVHVDTSAELLNHTVDTNLKHYAITRPERQQQEFEGFFEAAKAAAKIIPIKQVDNYERSDDTPLPTGHCGDFSNPEALGDPIIEPNCKAQYGCLYCKHYCVHADEEDLRKLFSLLYVIEEVMENAPNFTRSEDLLNDLSMRIKYLIVEVSSINEEMSCLVKSVEYDVMELGNITEFWEYRMQRYEMLGVVS